MEHVPVLRKDVQNYLGLRPGNTVIDATLGLGGHAGDILRAIEEKGTLYAFEQDERNLAEAKKRLAAHENQIVYIHDNFRSLKTGVSVIKSDVDAVLFDLGLSSPHVDDPKRGFSFMKDGPLDMRFDTRSGLTAADILNTYSDVELARIFFEYGDERFSRKIAAAICMDRAKEKFETTIQLASLLQRILPKGDGHHHPATRVFQALRIEVNDELNVLRDALIGAFDLLKTGGRMVVISYHSLEDRIVKNFFRDMEKPPIKDTQQAIYRNFGDPLIKILTKKPIAPDSAEIVENPRSRSAKLRAIEKLPQS